MSFFTILVLLWSKTQNGKKKQYEPDEHRKKTKKLQIIYEYKVPTTYYK